MTSTTGQYAAKIPIELFQSEDVQKSTAGWEIFENHEKPTDLQQGDSVEVRTTNPEIEMPDAPINEEAMRQKKITSMFLANRSHSTAAETSSLGNGSPTLDSPISKNSLKRPSTAMPTVSRPEEVQEPSVLTSIFSIDKISYDVVLYDDRLVWTPVSPRKHRRPSSGLFSSDSKRKNLNEPTTLFIHDICCVKLKNIRSARTGNSTTIGFAAFTAQERSDRRLKEHCILFICFSRDVCMRWATLIKRQILSRVDRPKHLLILSSGTMAATQVWDDIVEPKLEMACIKGHFVELNKPDESGGRISEILAPQSVARDNDSYDGIVVLGGARLFSEVVNAVIAYKEKALKSGVWLPEIPPIGVVPTSLSFVAKETHGCSDAETAMLHIIYGCTQCVPVCEFYSSDDQFLRHGLSASYGFSGGDTVRNSSAKGFAAMQGSIKKGFAFTKALVKLRSYPCNIQYKDSLHCEDDEDVATSASMEANGYSIVNHHFVHDDEPQHFEPFLDEKGNHSSTDGDSGIWPQLDKWSSVPRASYTDITITSLPQVNPDRPPGGPGDHLSTILLRDTMSRKDLVLGMGSQVSLSSTMSKSKPETQSKYEIIHACEFLIQPDTQPVTLDNSSSHSPHLSSWTIDGCSIDSNVQELHVKVHSLPLVMFGRPPGQPLSTPPTPDILKLDVDVASINLESMA